MTMLFRLAEWHALAKLRMHTDTTLARMEIVTSILGKVLRHFRDVACAAFSTVELPKEAAARGRKRVRRQKEQNPSEQPPPLPPAVPKRKKKMLSLSTYKLHSLPDYARTIRMFGTTDSYSTQTVSGAIVAHSEL
jgi:hypothetical protein